MIASPVVISHKIILLTVTGLWVTLLLAVLYWEDLGWDTLPLAINFARNIAQCYLNKDFFLTYLVYFLES